MKIVKIETFSNRHLCIVKVSTDDGHTGYGQTAPFHANITALVLHQQVAPGMIGTELHEPAEIAGFAEEHIQRHYKFPWSYICRAVCGVETALWDLFGKRAGKSVCELLGGKPRPIPVYGSSMRRDILPQDEAARLKVWKETKGVHAFKIRIGSGFGRNEDVYPGRSEENVAQARKTLGDNVGIYVDANSAYMPQQAIEVAHMLETYGVTHYEEPCPFNEWEWTKQVTDATRIPVAGGEQDNDIAVWRRLIATHTVDIVQPDICYIGGLSRACEVARMARHAGMVCTPHAANKSMVTIFTAHMLAAIPNGGELMEFSIEQETMTKGLFHEPLDVADGVFDMPTGPGWGIDINPAWLEAAQHDMTVAE